MAADAYSIPYAELLDRFMTACGRAGTSNSGLVIDLMAGEHLRDAHYLRGAVLARLERVEPPFRAEQVVETAKGSGSFEHWGPYIPAGKRLRIERVHYIGAGCWKLSFRELFYEDHGMPYYSTDDFTAVPTQHSAEPPR